MSRDHKKPMMAFVIVAVACAVLVVNAARSSAVELLRGPVPSVAVAQAWRLVPGVEQLRREGRESVATATDPGASPGPVAADGDQAPRPASRSTGSAAGDRRASSPGGGGSDDRRHGHAASTAAPGYPVTAGSPGSSSGTGRHPGHAPGHDGDHAGQQAPAATQVSTDSDSHGSGTRHQGRSHDGRSHDGRSHEGRSHEGRSHDGRSHEGRSHDGEGHRRGHHADADHEHHASDPTDHGRGDRHGRG